MAYRGGVAAASDRPGQNGHTFKGVRHPSRLAHGAPGGRCCLIGGPASASAPLMSGPRVTEKSQIKNIPEMKIAKKIARS
jgi:hypothetical protein